MKRYFIFLLLLFLTPSVHAADMPKHPDFSAMYLGVDKFEKFNRKMFTLNGALNKFIARPVSTIWTSIVPKYGIERLKYAYSNILYPRRFISTVVQRDFKAALRATARFITNSTIGMAGMFDPAKRFFNLNPINEDMEQAFAKLGIKQGFYLVLPIISSTTPRGLLGLAFDCALDPTSYIGSTVIAAIKAIFTINNASCAQSGIKMVQNSYIDPYDIAKKLYGVKCAILNANLDRDEVIKEKEKSILGESSNIINVSAEILDNAEGNKSEIIKGFATAEEVLYDDDLIPNIILENYNSKHPVIDSMRTALFEIEGVDNSIWAETSVWNRSFQNRIQQDSVSIYPERENYDFKYILQKEKTSPLVIIFPSIGENIDSHHSTHFAKLFYDSGYSVLILSSAFNHNFYKSMETTYRPGIPENDAKHLQLAASKIIDLLEAKNNRKFDNKVVFGTSYGAMSGLFLGDLETREKILNISKIISINPPIELFYAMNAVDNNSSDFESSEEKLKEKTMLTVAKIYQAYNLKNEGVKFEELPFNLEEAKLITSFIMHQKLTDLIFAIENTDGNKEFYKNMQNTNYRDYAMKYLANKENSKLEDFNSKTCLYKIENYLKNNKNYTIYHSLDDYLANSTQLKKLKKLAKNKMKLIDKGAHLGFLYRKEFLDDLKKEISINENFGI